MWGPGVTIRFVRYKGPNAGRCRSPHSLGPPFPSSKYTYTDTFTYTHIYIYMTYVYIYIYIYIYTYIHTYIHTYTHIKSRTPEPAAF